MDSFINNISKLTNNFHSSQLAMLNAMTCEKVLPIYSLFSQQESWGSVDSFEEALILQYQFIQGIGVSILDLDKIIEEIENYSPDLDEFENGLASYALDVAVIFIEALTFLKDKDTNSSINVASTARDLVDMYVQEKNNLSSNDPLLEIKIQHDNMMKKEIERQISIISKIQKLQKITIKEIEEIRELNLQFGEIAEIKILEELY
jgi:uncharacterized protein YjaG (DUF416 family)